MKSAKKEAINSRYNCVHRHHICPGGKMSHTPGVGGSEVFEKCARYLVEMEGFDAVHNWLREAKEEWPIVGKEALLRFLSIDFSEEMKHG